MRQLILNRIAEIKKREHDFPRGVMRWDNFSTGTDKRHISEIKFEELEDYDLLFLFERLIRRCSMQM